MMPQSSTSGLRFTGGLALVIPLLGGCVDPAKRYDDLVARIPPAPEAAAFNVCEQFDPSGRDFMINLNIRPLGNLPYQLLNHFGEFTENAAGELIGPAELRYVTQTMDDPPVVNYQVIIEPDGKIQLNIGTLDIAAEVSPIPNVAIVAVFDLEGCMLNEDEFCGAITDPTAAVIAPVVAPLIRTTFGALALPSDGTLPDSVNVPNRCPIDYAIPDASAPDVSAPPAEAGTPDVSAPPAEAGATEAGSDASDASTG